MQYIVGFLMLATLVANMQDWHDQSGTFNGRSNVAYDALDGLTPRRPARTARRRTGNVAVAALAPMPYATIALDSRSVEALIANTAAKYDVPEGALYGIWMVESSGRTGGWGNHWSLASELPDAGSACRKAYANKRSAAWCADQWERIRAICSQKRGNVSVCDPHAVRSSSAGALGPMQHLPTTLLKKQADGSYVWAEHAVDGNGDGVRDPHDLVDAMAMTAALLRKHHDRYAAKGDLKPWRKAVVAYSGAGNNPYYDGGRRGKGAAHYWGVWHKCRAEGTCQAVVGQR